MAFVHSIHKSTIYITVFEILRKENMKHRIWLKFQSEHSLYSVWQVSTDYLFYSIFRYFLSLFDPRGSLQTVCSMGLIQKLKFIQDEYNTILVYSPALLVKLKMSHLEAFRVRIQ